MALRDVMDVKYVRSWFRWLKKGRKLCEMKGKSPDPCIIQAL
jgi:hypothetical protein